MSDSAAGILDERADDKIRTDGNRLGLFCEFAVAVVNDNDYIGICALCCLDYLGNALNCESGAERLAS